MQRSTACRAAAALVLLLVAAGPAAAISNDGPEGPTTLYFDSPEEEAATKQVISMFAAMGEGREPSLAAAATVNPPSNLTSRAMAKVLATVLVSAAAKQEEVKTLGAPRKFPYPDGSGRHAYFRFPTVGPIRGTCIFVHGCKHDPMSWFYKSDACPECTGLPEEVSHTKQCLARGYVVFALMSRDRDYMSRCFSSSGTGNDHPTTKQVLDKFMAKYGMNKLPKFIFGISSGASFAIKFPGTYQLDGVVSEVNMPWEKAWGATDGKGKITTKFRFPPTVYYEMQRDLQTARQIEKAVAILRNNGIPSDVVYSPPRKVTPDFLYKRSIYISPEQSASVQKFLIKIGVLDDKGNVLYDVRVKRGWITKLPKFLPWIKRDSPYYNLISDESQIWQELNLAWSWHEIVSDYVRPTLMWLEAKGKADLAALVHQFNLYENIRCLTEYREGCGPLVPGPPVPATAPNNSAPLVPRPTVRRALAK